MAPSSSFDVSLVELQQGSGDARISKVLQYKALITRQPDEWIQCDDEIVN